MATSFATESSTQSPGNASWCFLLLEHLDEFATLAWYLVADGGLVEDAFARTMATLDLTAIESYTPVLAYSHAREVLITQAIAVLPDAGRDDDESQVSRRNSICSIPSRPRIAFLLRFAIHSSDAEIAKFLDVSPSEVQALIRRAIGRLSVVLPVSTPASGHDHSYPPFLKLTTSVVRKPANFSR